MSSINLKLKILKKKKGFNKKSKMFFFFFKIPIWGNASLDTLLRGLIYPKIEMHVDSRGPIFDTLMAQKSGQVE